MATRRAAAGNRIRGPQSALTDFLASHNISAADIRASYQQRLQQAQQQTQEQDATGTSDQASASAATTLATPATVPISTTSDESTVNSPVPGTSSSRRKRKRIDEASKQEEKVKKTKKGRKSKKGCDSDDELDSDYDDSLAQDMYKKIPKLPGQLENCEVCSKRFTVTPYSKTGPEGGLLCTPCGKELIQDSKPAKKAKKPSAKGRGRRKLESNRLDGTLGGVKSLQQLCIEMVAKNAIDIEEFGDLPPTIIDRLAEIFSKQKVLTPRTLGLFLQPDLDTIAVHDAAYLETENYQQIFAIMPFVEKVILQNACQFKNENMEYMIEKGQKIRHLQLYAANLVSDDRWMQLFMNRGEQLAALKLQWLDASFNDETVGTMVSNCSNLTRLKLKFCQKMSEKSIVQISKLTQLKHLSLRLSTKVSGECLEGMVRSVGRNLVTLSLEAFVEAADCLLQTIHATCSNLSKLRISENDVCTDAGYAALFKDWQNRPLRYADFSSTRHVDNTNSGGPEEAVGLASDGLKALMGHSGSKLEVLEIASCRHISHSAFSEVFDGKKEYPKLREVNISFCNNADTMTVAGIFKSCPALKKLVAFGCFNVSDVVVSAGIVLIGVPKAQDAIEQYGDSWLNVDQALSAMIVAGAG